MHNLEATTNDPGTAEQLLNLFGCGIGDHVKVLGGDAIKDVAQTAADQIGLKAALVEAIEHIQSGTAHITTGDVVMFAGMDFRNWQSGAGTPSE